MHLYIDTTGSVRPSRIEELVFAAFSIYKCRDPTSAELNDILSRIIVKRVHDPWAAMQAIEEWQTAVATFHSQGLVVLDSLHSLLLPYSVDSKVGSHLKIGNIMFLYANISLFLFNQILFYSYSCDIDRFTVVANIPFVSISQQQKKYSYGMKLLLILAIFQY